MERELLRRAVSEIKGLRQANTIMAAKVDVIEVFAAALGLRQNGGMMAEDLVWAIEQELNKPIQTSEVING